MPVQQIKHNNDGKFYHIAIDIAKEGAQLFDLTPYVKGRVGDNNFGLLVDWYRQGMLMNVNGAYKPVIDGLVGNFSFDKNGNLKMDDDASPVYSVGKPEDCGPAGQVTYYFPEQMFPKEGIFKGYLGLIDDKGNRYSGVDIWFSVLAGNARMGIACDFYISELEKIIKEAEEDLKAGQKEQQQILDEYSQKVTDLINQVNGQAADVQTTLTNLRTTIQALEAKAEKDNLFTQAEADAFKQSIIAEIDKKNAEFAKSLNSPQTEKIVDSSNWACQLPDYMMNNWNAVVNSIPHGEGIFNFGLITDNHYQPDNDYAYRSIDHYDWFGEATKAAKVDAVIVDGDNTNGANYDNKYAARFKEELYRSTANIVDLLEGACSNQSDIFWLKGNHDSGAWSANALGSQKPNPNNSLTENELLQLYHCNTSRYGEVRDNTSFYFYKDYPDVKIRLIGLNSLDDDDQLDADGNYAKKDINYHSFRQPQLNWLANTALKVPSDYQVILFFHTPLDGAFSTKNGMVNSGHLQSIIQAFIGGTSISINDVESKEPINGLNIDFTQQGPGVVIGIFNGHYHNDNYDNSLIPGVSMIEENASFNNGKVATRIRDTDSEDAWDLVSVNTKTRSVNMYRFGEGNDRHFNY
ncbi:metallophosphoesterase [Limosilactobacillus reuteri]|uniref:metallophosphoesterase n=1 Tax=Limosilactobacillus reuteri TaxID=1598 RepID=UPI0023609A8A|nr:metallophosphoesterase [Limosilactobacillus reuteri]MDD1406903.1 metallophosphoesterase [Limosilactobacillus reuteri]